MDSDSVLSVGKFNHTSSKVLKTLDCIVGIDVAFVLTLPGIVGIDVVLLLSVLILAFELSAAGEFSRRHTLHAHGERRLGQSL